MSLLKNILGHLTKIPDLVFSTRSHRSPVPHPVYRRISPHLGMSLAFPPLPGSEPKVLARFGEAVSARLESAPEAARVPADGLDMFIVRDFLTISECDLLIALIDSDANHSTTLRAPGTMNPRTSDTCRLPPNHPLVADVERRIAELLGLPATHSETAQGQRYSPGQQFRLHNDYFAGGQFYSETVAEEGGQRTWTAMIFLDEPEAGGWTRFPCALIEIIPRRGALLTWNNLDRHGMPNARSHHEGTIVEAGMKHVLTKWFREREWHSSATSDTLRE